MSLGKQMEVIKQQHGNVLELSIKGRLDNYWSEFLSERLNTVVNDGAHHLRLDLSEVNYLSSAGIGVLVRIHQQLKAIQGTFVIDKASDRVRAVLKLVALESILFSTASRPAGAPPASPAQTLEIEPGTIDVYNLAAASPMKCQLIGDPSLIHSGSVDAGSCQTRQLSDSSIALGLGAFGANYEDCRSRFGEFVAVGGCCAYLPTDGTSVPDYLVSAEKFVPEVQMLYGIECHGAPTQLLRFECRHDARLPLHELAAQCLKISGATTLVIAMLAEASKVVGAALSSSPAVAAARLDFPHVRDWISFFPAARRYTKHSSRGRDRQHRTLARACPLSSPFKPRSRPGRPFSYRIVPAPANTARVSRAGDHRARYLPVTGDLIRAPSAQRSSPHYRRW